ncbi:MAG: hypothetical protein R3C14_28505 [Caldilineaceae bacterium]
MAAKKITLHLGPGLLLALLAIPALLPFYQEGLPRSFDGGLHLLRLGILDSYVQQGILLPRWVPSLLLGYGYPLFHFYAPGAYYLAEILHLSGLSLYYAFIAAFGLEIVLAGLGMYWLALDSFGGRRNAALLAAVAYMYAPYLLTNVYIRGALAEAGAQALLPWIFWSGRRICHAEGPASDWLLFILTLGGLAITHNITLLFLPPVLLLYLGVQWRATGYPRARLAWLATALLVAMGISTFFWLPLLAERGYLADTAYTIARQVWLPGSVWSWQNFLDLNFYYQHTFARPIRLGSVQLGAALAGLLLARRRDAEWLYWLSVAIVASALMSAWALPLWLSNDILPVAQFTWRLLSMLSLPLALLAGGIVLRLPQPWLQSGVTVAVIALMIVAQQPRLAWMDVYAAVGATVNLPAFAQLEVDKGAIIGGEGNSSVQEFRPRWAESTLLLASTEQPLDGCADCAHFTLDAANDFALAATVTVTQATPLRLGTFYFPGWQVQVDGAPTSLYPSTPLGLLTVDLPIGVHQLQVRWVGTTLQHWANGISLLTLALLFGYCLWRRPRWGALAPGVLLGLAVGTLLWPQPMRAIEQPLQRRLSPTAVPDALELLGYRTATPEAGYLYLYPYWYVRQPLPADLRIRWQLLTAERASTAGKEESNPATAAVVSDFISRPYFNAFPAENWPVGAIMDDAYRLPLPAALPSGSYQVRAQLQSPDNPNPSDWLEVGEVTLTAPAPDAVASTEPMTIPFGDHIQLTGFDLAINHQPPLPAGAPLPVLHSGDYLHYTLYWQTTGAPATRYIKENYHSFLHLTDVTGAPLEQEDQLPGALFHPPTLWDSYRPQRDGYLLRIPPAAPSGLYWPWVGLYTFATLERLPVDEEGRDHGALPPIKVVNPAPGAPQRALQARFGDIVELLGYTIDGTQPLRAGDQVTLTLYYRVLASTKQNLTRFVQLYAPGPGMAAQQDSPPQQGGNPSWSWQPGEVIVDQVPLPIREDAAAGVYTVYIGFYDAADGQRLPVQDGTGATIPEAWAKLTELQITNQ